jgi:hypothetical protein
MTKTENLSPIAYESQVKKITTSKHPLEIELMSKSLNLYVNGFNLIDEFTFTEENKIESAWLFLIIRSFHSIRCAIQLTLMGYYTQALSLLRTVTEDYFICHDCYNYPLTTSAILYNEYKIPNKKLELTYKKMAERAGKIKAYEQDYHHQSQFLHCSSQSLAVLRDYKTNEIRAAPSYDTILFLDCCELMFRNALRMSEFIEHLLYSLSKEKSQKWLSEVATICKAITGWLNDIQTRYNELANNVE